MSNAESILVTSLQRELDSLTDIPAVRRLHRVPEHLRSLDQEGYTPRVVSIGPFHHGKQGLEDFEEEKLRCLKDFLSWSGLNLENLIKRVIQGEEDRLKSFYAPAGIVEKFTGDSFVKLILLDATFIVATMLGYFGGKAFRAGYDCLYRTAYTDSHIKRDLALLDNQVPLFILVDLYDMIKAAWNGLEWSFFKLAILFFRHVAISRTEIPDDYTMGSAPEEEVRHLVDLLTRYHRPSKPRRNPTGDESSDIAFRSLTELHECGVKLKLSTSKDALDIHYTNGTLEIPKIDISHLQLTVLENMVSFEQCYCRGERYVTDYVNLMANLLRSPNDVELLLRHGILAGWINQDICKFFYDLGRESLFGINKFYYRRLCEELDNYCKVPWHMWRATLRQEYFKNPFAVIAACLYFLIALLDLVDKRGWGTIFTTSICCLGLAVIAQKFA